MDLRFDSEFSTPEEITPLRAEINPPEAEASYPDELTDPVELAFPPPEYESPVPSAEEEDRRTKRRSTTRAILSMLAAISLAFVTLGLDPFGLSSSIPMTESADSSFPILSHREPNGSVPGYGVINEEYIMLENVSGSSEFIYAGSAYGTYDENGNTVPAPRSEKPGVSYDEATNTLTLSDFTGSILNINMMGNGFTLKIVGNNRIDHLLVWGFHYGGSILITGDGSLTVNEDSLFDVGILLRAEDSQSCLMVDKDVTLDVHGKNAAVFIEATTMDKAIYYLTPLTMTGGERKKGSFDFNGVTVDGYTVADDEIGPSTYVSFSKGE